MSVLSNLEAILVRATFSGQMISTSINGIRMQTAGDTNNSFQQATQVEICRCPPGYSGTSCETCARGYYRDISDRSQSILGACRRCPCNGKEESCEMDRRGQVVCHCSRGSGGTYCDEPGEQFFSRRQKVNVNDAISSIAWPRFLFPYDCKLKEVDFFCLNEAAWANTSNPKPSFSIKGIERYFVHEF